MIHVRNAWHVAAWSMDIGVDKPFAITIANDRIVIWRNPNGQVTALEDRCVHRLAPLSLGRCEGERLRCMYHGLLFNRDGSVAEIPGQDMISASASVRAYPVVDRYSWIWIWLGDPELADPALIPQAVGFDEPDWIMGRGQLDYAAEARLIHDNLCDFSHLSYVHPTSFGANDNWALTRPKVTVLDRAIRFERWVAAQSGMRGNDAAAPVDVWSFYEYHVPGILLMPTASYPAGTAERLKGEAPPPDMPKTGVTFTSQAVTALTDKTSRYFFSWGPHKDHGDVALRDVLMGIAGQAFGEDKVMIEAQQRVIDGSPDARIMPTSADKGVTQFNRLVERLARGEGQSLAVSA